MNATELAEHLQRPALRRIRPIPLKKDEQLLLGLQDPNMLVQQMMVVPAQAFQVIQLFNGERSLEEIGTALKMQDLAPLRQLVSKLDEFGLLWGPTCDALEDKKKSELVAHGAFAAGATRLLGDEPTEIRKKLEQWLDAAEDAEIDEPIAGIVACHLDFERGHPVYASSYRTIARAKRPDRVVILGTNHFGVGDGVVVSDLGFDSPLGRVNADRKVIDRLRASSGERLFKDILDHLPEHSIQLHLPWIQHLYGDVPVVAALVPDPTVGLINDDGARMDVDEFVKVLGGVLADLGGQTLFVASADMSHVGPAFGEPAAVNDQRRREVEAFDRELMREFIAGPDKLVSKMRANRNPTRWCSVGCMTAAAKLARPSKVELIDYRQAVDEKGEALVSSASMALLA